MSNSCFCKQPFIHAPVSKPSHMLLYVIPGHSLVCQSRNGRNCFLLCHWLFTWDEYMFVKFSPGKYILFPAFSALSLLHCSDEVSSFAPPSAPALVRCLATGPEVMDSRGNELQPLNLCAQINLPGLKLIFRHFF